MSFSEGYGMLILASSRLELQILTFLSQKVASWPQIFNYPPLNLSKCILPFQYIQIL